MLETPRRLRRQLAELSLVIAREMAEMRKTPAGRGFAHGHVALARREQKAPYLRETHRTQVVRGIRLSNGLKAVLNSAAAHAQCGTQIEYRHRLFRAREHELVAA